MIAHEQATTNPSLNANVEQGTTLQTHYHYFNHEGDSLAWLSRQP